MGHTLPIGTPVQAIPHWLCGRHQTPVGTGLIKVTEHLQIPTFLEDGAHPLHQLDLWSIGIDGCKQNVIPEPTPLDTAMFIHQGHEALGRHLQFPRPLRMVPTLIHTPCTV